MMAPRCVHQMLFLPRRAAGGRHTLISVPTYGRPQRALCDLHDLALHGESHLDGGVWARLSSPLQRSRANGRDFLNDRFRCKAVNRERRLLAESGHGAISTDSRTIWLQSH